MKTTKRVSSDGLIQYASHSVLVFSGSLLVLSFTSNNIGFDKIIDAYSQKIIAEIVITEQCNVPLAPNNKLEKRVIQLELDSHKSTTK